MPVSPSVVKEVQRLFPEQDVAAVVELLAASSDSERIHMDILRLSNRKVDRVRLWAQEARRDFRDVIVAAENQRFRTYVLWILHKGANWEGPLGTQQKAHYAAVRAMKEAGKLLLGGQLLDEEESWLYIFLVDSPEEARLLAEADPAIQSGHFGHELRPWRALEGLRMVPLLQLPY
jgi:uncharacterized protein YciI